MSTSADTDTIKRPILAVPEPAPADTHSEEISRSGEEHESENNEHSDEEGDNYSEREQSVSTEPLDTLPLRKKLKNLSYITFFAIGIGLLWPWNCILSASQYFKHDIFKDTSIWAKIFTSSMMSFSTISSMLFNIYLAKRQYKYSRRVINGLVWEIIVFTVMCFFTILHFLLPKWFNFMFIMVLVVISSMGTAMTQNGIMAIANVFGSEYSQGVMVGQAVAGVLPSLVLFALAFIENSSVSTTGGILLYFFTTTLMVTICVVMFSVSKISRKVNENWNVEDGHITDVLLGSLRSNEEEIRIVGRIDQMEDEGHRRTNGTRDDNDEGEELQLKVPFEVLFAKLKYLVLSIFTTFVVTLVFPVFASATYVTGLPLSNAQYIPLIFTLWNLGDLYGRVIADWPMFRDQKFTPRKTFIYSLLRVAAIPLFLMFTAITSSSSGDEEHNGSVIVDLCYMLLQFLFGVTNGHVISMSFMKVPEQLDNDDEKEAAGGFTNIFVSTGLALGSIISYVFVFIIDFIIR
ncbi:CGH_1_collapsed_G0000450.mRNA.1.CDS.1 [Saccharomyces cerevisiae]|nr:CGH_1_HP_G0017350.mRNA.1.CDS.1 [Saccharomyces cerevisiae]CAI5015760.1 CGH_1_HP_G0088080.mRNA.1.CDS.1 [Saccharomyces cerevisiae]CAI5021066.1 CGH_1_HP_G0092940.mRNA.1.CDS.1 [Saccharomyces cerevisiae]CAI6438485.1 CGH_1_HP_G0017350.mRNA.1.CDS.1 [Saccharomyces cerevisiae]CAI6933696.1 CGH_1_HP_G0088080.mRNA.1.CDS.1 [Saccharomyces cerevisiae]